MAPPPGTLRVGRYFMALLALLALLYLLAFWPGKRHTPKLGLDLVGGQQVTFQARAPHGSVPSSSAMSQALQIMRERVNGSGVTEAEVVQQGQDEIVVSIPGGTKTDVAKLGAAAKLNFRGLVAPAVPISCGVPAPGSSPSKGAGSSSPSGSNGSSSSTSPSRSASTSASRTASKSSAKSGQALHVRPLTAPKPTGSSSAAGSSRTSTKTAPSGSGTATTTPSASGSPTSSGPVPCALKSVAQLKQAVKLPAPNTVYKTNGLPDTVASQVSQVLGRFDCSTAQTAPDPKNDYYVACDKDGVLAYLLGPVIVPGTEIDDAQGAASTNTADWSVRLTLKDNGLTAWGNYTGKHNINSQDTNSAQPTSCSTSSTPCADFVGFTLDGRVISAPVNESAINTNPTSITGSFTQSSANDLAQQLKYGALPLTFKAQQAQTVSATLGTSQLKAGLLAGGIGLVLVVLYSLIYYRALGLVTIASLLVSGALTYAMLVFLGRQIGFTLSLAGIAGFIVAVGITADSFVVFFERIKDEVHEGRSMRVAVPRAWVRARRTVLSADTVSFLAAAILYYFAAGDVKGFAFTLGMSTILDLVVVFLFTHPMVSLLSRSRAFGSARFTGLSNVRSGGIVRAEDDPEAARPNRSAARARRAGAAGSAGTATRTKPARSELTDEEPPADTEADSAPDSASEADAPPTGERTAPEATGGTAAERAAARRARMRQRNAEQGKEGER